ncbi:hypothetical protein T484DRAFT_1877157 [Baffinella frigidus]|nr:hypothetical protein T484DRAFT_1877157 [Cryptophyta sp. CCMP2293]|mmetsp:Transcript_45344/g.108134  ORF Transcript_45344/g.108134 Transcript_45344/m.108134 type:complete len:176 (+) Transcript_45344:168-695(+)|eukprot:CAMPEP_0180127034 /NCGR_PEP_ID=MMETSP0986-20121125/6020_1 /TAXON_ID=697907 /ORGANISM="non described non described, Strain CCMP2293" /LENGTH=175 /DNA_ID=CAMNT_0022066515 /DNA_START=161 /DNA_END=688 /DNA_ORIENTATION=+
MGWDKGFLSMRPKQERVSFGSGNQKDEEKCAEIHVFMRCVGVFRSGDTQHVKHPPHVTIAEARKEFAAVKKKELGRDMAQQVVHDERNYAMNPQDLDKPLAAFSNRCNLNLDFTYRLQGTDLIVEGVEIAAEGGVVAARSVVGYGKTAAGGIGEAGANTARWIGNKFKTSSPVQE